MISIANHVNLIRELLRAMGIDPDRAIRGIEIRAFVNEAVMVTIHEFANRDTINAAIPVIKKMADDAEFRFVEAK